MGHLPSLKSILGLHDPTSGIVVFWGVVQVGGVVNDGWPARVALKSYSSKFAAIGWLGGPSVCRRQRRSGHLLAIWLALASIPRHDRARPSREDMSGWTGETRKTASTLVRPHAMNPCPSSHPRPHPYRLDPASHRQPSDWGAIKRICSLQRPRLNPAE